MRSEFRELPFDQISIGTVERIAKQETPSLLASIFSKDKRQERTKVRELMARWRDEIHGHAAQWEEDLATFHEPSRKLFDRMRIVETLTKMMTLMGASQMMKLMEAGSSPEAVAVAAFGVLGGGALSIKLTKEKESLTQQAQETTLRIHPKVSRELFDHFGIRIVSDQSETTQQET